MEIVDTEINRTANTLQIDITVRSPSRPLVSALSHLWQEGGLVLAQVQAMGWVDEEYKTVKEIRLDTPSGTCEPVGAGLWRVKFHYSVR